MALQVSWTQVRRVFWGTGRGSAFSNGRILWVHKPWASDPSKAQDPFINLGTLTRISYNRDLVDIVADNLAERIEKGLTLKEWHYVRENLYKDAILKALVTCREVHSRLKPIGAFIESLAVGDFEQIDEMDNGRVLCAFVAAQVSSNPQSRITPKSIDATIAEGKQKQNSPWF